MYSQAKSLYFIHLYILFYFTKRAKICYNLPTEQCWR
uniref:Uncharacterized protein n=1 Tax=Siphoviridae sp. ctXZx16 TaxID=2826371 RepID=A0A8S5MLK4_9CAUD|nr:MAG TPA: hypothetical protein [Siphoviridae sp. ctXZx16]